MKRLEVFLFLLFIVFLFPRTVSTKGIAVNFPTQLIIGNTPALNQRENASSLPTPTSTFTTTTYHWEQITLPTNVTMDRVKDFAVHPVDAYTIFLGTSVGLYRSIDAGPTWTQIAPTTLDSIYQVDIAPSTPQRLYVQATNFSWGSRLYRSDDGGGSWYPLLSPPSNCGLSVAPSDPDRLYVRKCRDGGNLPALFRSDDGGQSWITPTLSFTSTLNALEVSPTQPNLMIAVGYDDIFRSTDGGSSWSSVFSNGDLSPEIVFDADYPYAIYIGRYDGGLLRSLDLGASWEDSNMGRDVLSFIDSPFAANQLYGLSDGYGDDKGAAWRLTSSGAAWRVVPWDVPYYWNPSLRRSFKDDRAFYMFDYYKLWRYIGREQGWRTSLFLPLVHRAPNSNFPDAARQALDRTNAYRERVRISPFQLHSALIASAQNHANYYMLNFNDPGAWIDGMHGEVEGYPGFTGEGPGYRVIAAGYPWSGGGEVMHFIGDPVSSVDDWMATVYHRFPLLDPDHRHMGYGFGKNAQTAVDVINFGAGPVESGIWLSTFPFPLAYPADGQTDVPLSWDGYENPDPLPPGASHPVGYTFTLQGVGGYVHVDTIEMRDGHGQLVAVHPNPPCSNGYALIPVSPLEPGTRYTVQAQGNIVQWHGPSTNSVPFNRSWTFTTTMSGIP